MPARIERGTLTTTSGRVTPGPLDDFLPTDDEQETLIRKPPAGWEAEVAQGPPASPRATPPPQSWSDDAEQETVIRKAPPELVDEHQPAQARTGTGSTSGSTSGRRTGTGSSRRRKSSGSRFGVGVLGWILSSIALFVGLITGATAVLVLGLAAGFEYVPADAPTRQAPRIEFVVPPNTMITVDGDAVGQKVTVEADVPHKVVVTLKGASKPWETQVKLGMGETRVIVLSAPEAPAAPRAEGKAPKPR
jgi:hypothetical protein